MTEREDGEGQISNSRRSRGNDGENGGRRKSGGLNDEDDRGLKDGRRN